MLEKRARVTPEQFPGTAPITTKMPELQKMVRPGDIILTKKPKVTGLSRIINLAQGFSPEADWTHVGIVAGKDKVIHAYHPISKKGGGAFIDEDKGPSGVMEHSFDELRRLKREVLIMRPKGVGKGEAQKAIEKARGLIGADFNNVDLLRTLVPSERTVIKKDMTRAKKRGLICTAVPALAYPRAQFHPTKSRMEMKPVDFVRSKKLTPVVAYSREKTSEANYAAARARQWAQKVTRT